MRKLLTVALTVFALAFTIGMLTPNDAGALFCAYRCSCDGFPMKCCVNRQGVEKCQPTNNFTCSGPLGC